MPRLWVLGLLGLSLNNDENGRLALWVEDLRLSEGDTGRLRRREEFRSQLELLGSQLMLRWRNSVSPLTEKAPILLVEALLVERSGLTSPHVMEITGLLLLPLYPLV